MTSPAHLSRRGRDAVMCVPAAAAPWLETCVEDCYRVLRAHRVRYAEKTDVELHPARPRTYLLPETEVRPAHVWNACERHAYLECLSILLVARCACAKSSWRHWAALRFRGAKNAGVRAARLSFGGPKAYKRADSDVLGSTADSKNCPASCGWIQSKFKRPIAMHSFPSDHGISRAQTQVKSISAR